MNNSPAERISEVMDRIKGKIESEDMVNNPSHYGGADNPYEVIKVLRAWGLNGNFCLGNVIKYISRAGKKYGDTKLLEDLKKARWYLDDEIKALENEKK